MATQLYHLEELQDLDIKGLDELSEDFGKRKLSNLKKLEKAIYDQRLAPSLSAWLAFESQFVRKNHNELAMAMQDISGITINSEEVSELLGKMNIPERKKRGRRPKTPYKGILRNIAEVAIRKNLPINSHTVRKYSSDSFYNGYAFGREAMGNLVEQIKEIDPERYGHFQYIPQKKSKIGHKILTADEQKIFQEICSRQGVIAGSPESWPKGTTAEIAREFKKINPEERSDNSISYQVEKLKNGGYKNYNLLEAKHPLKVRSVLEAHIESAIQELEEKEKEKPDSALTHLLGHPHERKERRNKLHKLLPPGHQKLLAYLTDRDNYKRLFEDASGEWELVAADLRESETSKDLYKPFAHRLKNLEKSVSDPTIEFENHAIRCDLVYRKKGTGGENNSGIYAVVEVKQNALNRTPTKNVPHTRVFTRNGKEERAEIKDPKKETPDLQYATLSRQQLDKYCGALDGNIRWKNHSNRNNLEYQAVVDPTNGWSVKGFLAAYQVQGDLYDYLNDERSDRAAFVFSKQEVDEYVAKAMSRQEKQVAKVKAPEKAPAPRTVRKKKKKKSAPQPPRPQRIKRTGRDLEIFLGRQRAFQRLRNALGNVQNNLEVGTYDAKRRLVEIYTYDIDPQRKYDLGPLYKLEGSNGKDRNDFLAQCVQRGILRAGAVHDMKYRANKVLPIDI